MLRQLYIMLWLVAPLLCWANDSPTRILNVSYDPTRELYNDFNHYFESYWKQQTGQEITVTHSHAGSATQARAVINGLPADVVSLGLAYDIDIIAAHGLMAANWQSRLPHDSCPYTSTIVFVVRKGNPKGIHDWPDLLKPGVSVLTPNPKTSGAARWSYLAAYGYALKRWNNDQARAMNFVTRLYANVPILTTGSREATTTFVERDIGDVLIAWENEALLVLHGVCRDTCELVRPSLSILTEPPVAIVDTVVDKRHSRAIAEAYLKQLYSQEGQRLIAKHFYRPRDPLIATAYRKMFPKIPMLTIQDFGGWQEAQKTHFADGGTFDQVVLHRYGG